MTAEEFGRKYLLWILLVIAAFFVVKYYFGVTLPGSFFERGREYQAKVYVLLYPEGADAKNYRVPADIYKYSEGGYGILKVYWPDGGATNLNDCTVYPQDYKEYCTSEELTADEEDHIHYTVKLTREAVHPNDNK